MDAGTDIPETIQLKTLIPGQEKALNQMLRGVMEAMGQLELGTPYGGGLESSYSPYTPTYQMPGEAVPKEVERNGTVVPKKEVERNGTVVPKEEPQIPPTEKRTVLDEILDIVQKRQEPTEIIQPGTPQIPPYGQPSTELPPPPDAGPHPVGDEQAMLSQVLKSILSPSPMPAMSPGTMPFSPVNVPPAGDVLPPEAQPVSPISQLLTQPFTQPFREGMTGNYPGPTLRRR